MIKGAQRLQQQDFFLAGFKPLNEFILNDATGADVTLNQVTFKHFGQGSSAVVEKINPGTGVSKYPVSFRHSDCAPLLP